MGKNKLGAELARLRNLRGKTLRDVEDDTGISNAYLSQLETGKAEKPRPHVLHRLAKYYGVRYEELMSAAGYLESKDGDKKQDGSLAEIQLMSAGLTEEQRQQVKKFIRFLQSQE
jgi:HTH-type transcriptional regulator, competence development regulator